MFTLNNSESNQYLHLSFTDIQNISILTDIQHQIENFLTQKEVPAKSMHRLMLVLEDLITNAFKYGFQTLQTKP
jgi:anti-sigma regulatory factor (Ser/Thr protein kinase)